MAGFMVFVMVYLWRCSINFLVRVFTFRSYLKIAWCLRFSGRLEKFVGNLLTFLSLLLGRVGWLLFYHKQLFSGGLTFSFGERRVVRLLQRVEMIYWGFLGFVFDLLKVSSLRRLYGWLGRWWDCLIRQVLFFLFECIWGLLEMNICLQSSDCIY